jgi:hypothetical protein
VSGGRFTTFLSWLGHSLAWNEQPRRPSSPSDPGETDARKRSAAEASADMGWLSLSDDAGGHSIHEGEVTFLGVTPDDIDSHDANGGDLSWISLSGEWRLPRGQSG